MADTHIVWFFPLCFLLRLCDVASWFHLFVMMSCHYHIITIEYWYCAVYWQNTGKMMVLTNTRLHEYKPSCTHVPCTSTCSSWPVNRAMEESPVMVGAVLLMGGMWGYPGGPIREEMLCLESMYMFPVGEQTKGQWLTVRLVSRLSHVHMCLFAEHKLLSCAHTVLLLSYAKLEKSYRMCSHSVDFPLVKYPLVFTSLLQLP